MSCSRCALDRNTKVLLRGLVRPDPFFPLPLRYVTHGPRLEPPEGFERPRICAMCGVVYFPIVGEARG